MFGQLDLFILQWEEVLCDAFDLTVLDPSDRRGTDTYVGDMTIGYDPPRRGRVIPMAVYLNKAHEYVEDGGS